MNITDDMRRPDTEAAVERVAQIIDPVAWEKHEDNPNGYWNERRSIARSKARAAIAAMEG